MTKAMEARGRKQSRSLEAQARDKERRRIGTLSLGEQERDLARPETMQLLGAKYCRDRLKAMRLLKRLLAGLACSDAWFAAAWEHRQAYPPLDHTSVIETVGEIHRAADRGRIAHDQVDRIMKGLYRAQRRDEHLTASIDGFIRIHHYTADWIRRVEGHLRAGCRMVVVAGKQFGLSWPPMETRRAVPPQAARVEGMLDSMEAMAAYFYEYPPSPTGLQIQKIGMMKGRWDSELKRERRQQKALEKQRREARAIAAGRLPAEGLKVFEEQSIVEGR